MNTRALEAGARIEAIRRYGTDGAWADCVPAVAAVITAYEAHLKAEGFVVVPREPTAAMIEAGDFDLEGEHTPANSAAATVQVYQRMLSAAQEPNDASDR